MIGCSAHAQLDSDGDGLSNDDETAVYFTDPNASDTDGDGMPDGLETQMGTDPRNASSVFRMLSPVTLAGGVRRFCWSSQSGTTYEFQNADPGTNGPGGLWVWRAITNLTATGASACVDVLNPSGLYRAQWVVATNNDSLPPLLSLIQAIAPPPGALSALLSVVARDLAGVVRVEFLDGASVLGTATRGAGNTWSFSWPLHLNLNGRHHLRARAYDAAGNIGYSPVVAFDVSLGAQSCLTVGSVQVCADSIVAANGALRATGHLRVGGVTFSADTTLTISGTQISGTGSVTVPGLGTVLTGSFDINTTTGWLTVHAGTTPIYNGIVFNPRTTLNPTQLLLNVFSNSLCTSGSLTLQVPGHAFGPATFKGSICFDPLAATLSAVGNMTMSSLSATGTATLLLRDSTFTLAGNARLTSSNGDVYTVSNGVAGLNYVQAVPTIAVSGRLGIPDDIAVQVQGHIAADGAMTLTGSNGQGSMNGFRFAAATGTLTRPAGLNSIVTLQFNARLVHTNLINYLVSGSVRSTGDIDISGTGTATFTTNLNSMTVVAVFNPLNAHLRGNVFAGTVSNAISGTLQAPNYLEPVQFSGIMRADGSVDIIGNSGPYTAATFGGLVPAMDAPNLSFEKRLFVGAYHLFSRNNQTAALVNLRFTRTSDASGGIATLAGVADVTTPGLPPLTLTGNASSTGAASLSGSTGNQNSPVWGYQVNNLACGVARSTNGVFTFNVLGGSLVYSGLNGAVAQTFGSISSDGSGFINFTYNTCTLNGYAMQNVTLRLAQTTAGVRTLSILGSSRLLVPGFVGMMVQVSGSLTNNGTFLLTGATTNSMTLNNLPVASMSASAFAALTHNGLTIAGNVNGGVLLRVPVVFPAPSLGVVPAALFVPASGPISITGCMTVSPIVAGQFRIESTAPDGSFSACFAANGLVFPSTARLIYRGTPLTLPAMPLFTVSSTGDFAINISTDMTVGFQLNGYNMPSLSFTLVRSGNVTFAQNVKATVSTPASKQGFTTTANFGVAGTLYSDGAFALTNSSGSKLDLMGLPVDSVSAMTAGSVIFRHTGLTITGSMSGGVLAQVPAATAIGTLTVGSNGHTTLAGCITVSPLVYGQFRLESTAPGGSFSACFGTEGLTFPANGRLLYRGAPLTLPALPEFTIGISGDFSISVSAAMTAGLTLNGYNLPTLRFTLVRSGNVTFAQNVIATVRAPGFSPGFTAAADFAVNGTFNSDGTFNLLGTGGSSLELTGLPVGAIGVKQSGSVSFTEAGLSMGGSLSGGVFSQIPVRPVSGGGWLGEYYDNMDFTGTRVSRIDNTIDFDWANGQPVAGIGADTFSVRWTGWLRADRSETYTFFTTSDDGVRLWINDQLVINNWTDHGPTEDSATFALQAGGYYKVRMEYYENSGGSVARLAWSSFSQPREIIPSTQIVQPSAGSGLLVEYFDNSDFTGPRMTRVDAAINFDWGNGQPDPGLDADTFSVRWTGKVQAQFSETYTFYTTSDDGVRLWVNNQLLINNWTDHAPTENSATIALKAGQYYDIRMEYYENGGGALARLEWSSARLPREIIPEKWLTQESPMVNINGSLTVANNGYATVSGCITVAPLVFGQFRLESDAPEGSFTACLGTNGLTLPAGARLLYRGAALTLPALPEFTLTAHGNFSVTVTAAMTAGVSLNGFNLPSLSFTLTRTAGVLAVQNVNLSVAVPAFALGFTLAQSFSLTGDMNADGTFNLTGTGGSSLSLTGLPIGTLDANTVASVNFRDTGLTVRGSCGAGVLNRLPVGFTAIAMLNIGSNGAVTLNGSVTCPVLQNLAITIERIAGGLLEATLDNSGLHFSNWQVRVTGVFNLAVSLAVQTMNADGSFSVNASGSPGGFAVVGYGFANIALTANRSASGTLSITGFGGDLFNVSGFNQRLTGSINNAGTVTFDRDTAVTLGGFTSSSGGHLALRNGGLTASGNFTLSLLNVSGNFSASAVVTTDGTYTGTATLSLTLNGYSTSGSPLVLSNTGLSGTRTLNYGSGAIPINITALTPSGISFNGSRSFTDGVRRFLDPASPPALCAGPVVGCAELGDVYAGLQATVSLNANNSTGSFSATASGTFAWWVVVDDLSCTTTELCGTFPVNLYYTRWCADIRKTFGSIPSNQKLSIGPVPISSSGQVLINESQGGQNGFNFDLWN